jgi:HD superfamily phosphohydrolase
LSVLFVAVSDQDAAPHGSEGGLFDQGTEPAQGDEPFQPAAESFSGQEKTKTAPKSGRSSGTTRRPRSTRDAEVQPVKAPQDQYELPPVVQEFFIPVWSQVRLTASEVKLINHPAFARLSDIYQLGQTYLVFRGGTHRRWEHALGTLYTAQLMASAVARNHREAAGKGEPPLSGKWRRVDPLQAHELAFVRLAALLHDIGHIAAGHTFEDELGLLDKHDADPRLTHILDREEWLGAAELHSLRVLIDVEYDEAAKATGLGLSASEVFLELVSKSRADVAKESPNFRMRVCRDIVGNTICADLLDYLHRDWYHLGKPRPFDSRLLDYFEIRQNQDNHEDTRLVVNLRGGSEVRLDAVTAIFELLESRYQLGEVALFHRTKLTASAMLERLIAEIGDAAGGRSWFEGNLDLLLECTDEGMLDLLVSKGKEVAAGVGGRRGARLNKILGLGRSLRLRQLHKKVVAFKSFELPTSTTFVRETLGGHQGASRRLAVCRSLETDFHLDPGSVVIYCPAKAPHAKIARVQVLIHGRIDALSELEDEGTDPAMTGGLLDSQQRRFDRLWRVQVSISDEARRTLRSQNTFSDFERTIECLVLKAHHGSLSVEETAREIAAKLVANSEFDTGEKVLVAAGEFQARTATEPPIVYPTGAPTLASLLIEP